MINRIRHLISRIKVADEEDIKITTSGGITSFHGTESSEDLVANANKALEFAVEQGRDRVAGFLYQPPTSKEESLSEDAELTEEAEEGSEEKA